MSNKLIWKILRKAEKPFNHRIFFLHIPKCGGTSLSRAVGKCFEGESQGAKFSLDPEAAVKSAKNCNMSYLRYSEALLLYHMAKKDMKYITGHFLFSERAYGQYETVWDFITILRNPVSRWFSQYFFNRYKTADHFKTQLDLETYMNSKEGIGSALTLVSTLCGTDDYRDPDPERGVTNAIANLKKFALVGCVEHMDLFTERFAQLYRFKLDINTLNKNPISKSMQEQLITPEIMCKIEEMCKYDLEVYNYALTHGTRFHAVNTENKACNN